MYSLIILATLVSPALADDSSPTTATAVVEPSNHELQRRMDVIAEELERVRIGEAAAAADESTNGMGPAASKVYRSSKGMSFGGYGEVKYRNEAAKDQRGVPSGKTDSVDVQRMILYAGYKFDDRWVLNTEIEYEHVKEVFVEFAYIDFRASKALGVRAGLMLMPMGIIGELHEPTTFPSVNRPEVEKAILPSTWREIGVGAYGEAGPITYRAYIINGMNSSGFDAKGIRGGRQKGAEAIAENFAGVARVDLTGVQGMVLGGSAYYGDSSQDLSFPVSTFIYEGHFMLDVAGFRARALYAGSKLGNVGRLNRVRVETEPEASAISSGQGGYYAEVGYDVFSLVEIENKALIPHLRYEALDTQIDVPGGVAADLSQRRSDITAGVAYMPHPQITLKLDYQVFMNQASTGVNRLNGGMGFIF